MEKKQLSIGQRIKVWRSKRGLSQDALSKKADVPYTTLAKIEIDVIRNPSLHTITKIADGLEIKIDDLVRG